MNERISITWITTPDKQGTLKFSGNIPDIVIWNRAGRLRYFPRSIVTNFRDTLKMIAAKPNLFEITPTNINELSWKQGLPLSPELHKALQLMITG